MTDKILEVRGLTKTYGGVKKRGAKKADPTLDVLKGIDLDIYRGDVVCLIGPSGCGKSTFLRCLNRLETPSSGSIKFEGVEVDESASFDDVVDEAAWDEDSQIIHIVGVINDKDMDAELAAYFDTIAEEERDAADDDEDGFGDT